MSREWGTGALDDLRDCLAMRLHGELCDGRHDDRDRPCWTNWRDEADELMPDILRSLAAAWSDGSRVGSVWLSASARDQHNPFIEHDDFCGCEYCRHFAVGR